METKGEPLVEGVDFTPSSGNVFADLGLPDADKLAADADKALREHLAENDAACQGEER
jgi:hypothetical protein